MYSANLENLFTLIYSIEISDLILLYFVTALSVRLIGEMTHYPFVKKINYITFNNSTLSTALALYLYAFIVNKIVVSGTVLHDGSIYQLHMLSMTVCVTIILAIDLLFKSWRFMVAYVKLLVLFKLISSMRIYLPEVARTLIFNARVSDGTKLLIDKNTAVVVKHTHTVMVLYAIGLIVLFSLRDNPFLFIVALTMISSNLFLLYSYDSESKELNKLIIEIKNNYIERVKSYR